MSIQESSITIVAKKKSLTGSFCLRKQKQKVLPGQAKFPQGTTDVISFSKISARKLQM
jgi:hypothetical protein